MSSKRIEMLMRRLDAGCKRIETLIEQRAWWNGELRYRGLMFSVWASTSPRAEAHALVTWDQINADDDAASALASVDKCLADVLREAGYE